MGSKTRLPKICANKDSLSSSEDEDDYSDNEYGEVDILRIDHNGKDQYKKVGFNVQRSRTAYREHTQTSTAQRPWSSTLRQPDPRWGKRLLFRRQSTEEYLEQMSDEVFDRVNRLSRTTAATMARDSDKTIKPYLSPREKKRPIHKQPLKISIDYSLRFKGSNKLRDGDIKDVVNRLYKVDPVAKRVGRTSAGLKRETPSKHNSQSK